MPNEYRPTSSASAISSSRCAIRSSGPTTRPVEGSVTAATKLSTPRCTGSSWGTAPDGPLPFNAQPAVDQVPAVERGTRDYGRDRGGGALVRAQLGRQLRLPGQGAAPPGVPRPAAGAGRHAPPGARAGFPALLHRGRRLDGA